MDKTDWLTSGHPQTAESNEFVDSDDWFASGQAIVKQNGVTWCTDEPTSNAKSGNDHPGKEARCNAEQEGPKDWPMDNNETNRYGETANDITAAITRATNDIGTSTNVTSHVNGEATKWPTNDNGTTTGSATSDRISTLSWTNIDNETTSDRNTTINWANTDNETTSAQWFQMI